MTNTRSTNIAKGHAPEDNTILENANDHCNLPTMDIIIAANGPASFDREVIELPTNTCVTIWFYNIVDFPHNFVIEPVEGDTKFDVVWMDLENSSSVCGQAESDHGDTPGIARFNILTPKIDTNIEFYCSYPGHYEAGMHGILKIGKGNATENNLNFQFISLSFLILVQFAYFIRKTENK